MSSLILPAVLSGLTMGAIYALVALGMTLIYGVLHIINFAHGSLLMLALYAAYFLFVHMGLDPYLAIPILLPVFFCLGYVLQRWVIAPMSGGFRCTQPTNRRSVENVDAMSSPRSRTPPPNLQGNRRPVERDGIFDRCTPV